MRLVSVRGGIHMKDFFYRIKMMFKSVKFDYYKNGNKISSLRWRWIFRENRDLVAYYTILDKKEYLYHGYKYVAVIRDIIK